MPSPSESGDGGSAAGSIPRPNVKRSKGKNPFTWVIRFEVSNLRLGQSPSRQGRLQMPGQKLRDEPTSSIRRGVSGSPSWSKLTPASTEIRLNLGSADGNQC